MALKQKSLILYGLQITANNRSIDFQLTNAGPIRQATLNLGYYSLSSLLTEIGRALSAADNSVTYTVTADRTVAGGLQNRITIAASGSFFSLLFGSGPRAASALAPLIGFNSTDYTGALTYTGAASAGTSLVTSYIGYNYMPPELYQEVMGSRSISASGVKEAVVFQVQQFIGVEFKYEPKSAATSSWAAFLQWAIQQRVFDFTPEYDVPGTFYQVTLEKSQTNQNGLAYQMKEQLPQFPNYYTTGPLTFRVVMQSSQFL